MLSSAWTPSTRGKGACGLRGWWAKSSGGKRGRSTSRAGPVGGHEVSLSWVVSGEEAGDAGEVTPGLTPGPPDGSRVAVAAGVEGNAEFRERAIDPWGS